jgi:hypothetical protein
MNQQTTLGSTLALSNPIINAAANAVGVAKTGAAIGTLHGAAHTSATAAWVGFGSMKVGMLMMGALPVIGAILILDRISGRDHGVPIIDWYEEFWKRYEVDCELEEMKQTGEINSNHQLRAKTTAAALAQLDNQFRALEVEHELYLMKKDLRLA